MIKQRKDLELLYYLKKIRKTGFSCKPFLAKSDKIDE